MVVPKLRFKEFDGDWSQVKLKDLVLSLDAGVSVNGEDVSVTEDDFSVLKTSCVSLGAFNPNERKKVTLEHEILRLKEPLLNNSLVMNRSNTPLLVASSAFIRNAPKKTYLSDKLWQFKVNQNANIQWIAFHLSNETTLIKLRDMATGTSNSMKNITKPDVLNFDLIAPSKSEQTKIASFLSAVDEKISQLTQKHQLLSQYKQGMMQKLFSQQIRFKADDGSEFGEWKEKELKEVAEINPKAKKLPANFIYIDLESVEKGQLLLQKNIELQDAPSRAQRLLTKGDVLFQMVRPYQQNNYYFNLSGEYVASTGYAQIRTKLDSKFIYYALHEKTFLDEVMNRCTGTSYPAINSSDLSSIEMFVPCLEEQTKIANFLSAIDQKIEVVAQQIEQVKTWKKGLLQQMFV